MILKTLFLAFLAYAARKNPPPAGVTGAKKEIP
jgi:hypothetical protein